MAGSWGRKGSDRDQPWSTEHSASKKRKVEVESEQHERQDETKDEWGDGEEFTQDELEALDVIASQVMCQSKVPESAQASEQRDVSFAVPSHKALSSVSRSTSSGSDSSVLPHSLSSRSSSETTSTLLSSHSSSNGKLDPSREVIQSLQAKLEDERKRAQEDKYLYTGENLSLRDKLHKQEEEMEKLRSQRDERYEQHMQAHSQKVGKLQSQLDSLNTQAQFKEKDYQTLQEQYNLLVQKLKRLEPQPQPRGSGEQLDVQLPSSPKPASPRKIPVRPSPPSKQKKQEMKESVGPEKSTFPTRNTFMEQTAVSGTKFTVTSISCQTTDLPYATMPPKCRRLGINTGNSNAFGSLTSPQVVRHLLQTSDREAECREVTERTSWDPGLVGILHDMSTSLRIADLTYTRGKDSSFLTPLSPKKQNLRSSSVGTGHGCMQVVSRQNLQLAIEGIRLLLDEDINRAGNGDKVSEMRTSGRPSEKKDGDKRTDTTSDHSRDVQHGKGTAEKGKSSHETGAQIPVESSSHDPSAQNRGQSVPHPGSGTSQAGRTSHEAGAQTPKESATYDLGAQNMGQSFRHWGAAMLLPVLTDYIQHYVDLVQSSFGRAGALFTPGQAGGLSPSSADCSTSYTASMSSTDSSFDCLHSHVGQLVQEGRVYTSSVEGYAVTALRCLALLIRHCPVVGNIVMTNCGRDTVSSAISFSAATPSSSSTARTEVEQQSKKSSSSVEADDEHSTSSSEIRVIIGTQSKKLCPTILSGQHLPSCSSLLHLVMRLASQDLEDGQSNSDTVKLALNVLAYLAECCTEDQLMKLETVIARGILTSCFRQTKFMSIHIWAQRLLVALARSEKLMARLCTKSENCPLYLLHRAYLIKPDGTLDLCREYVRTLSSLISEHRSGLRVLLSNACPCSNELVVAVVMTLYKLLSTYKAHESQEEKQPVLNCLAQGVILIHSLAREGGAFTQRIKAVRLSYVRLLSSLLSIMRSEQKTWWFHLPALDELCDFEPDSSDMSQEGDAVETMEHL